MEIVPIFMVLVIGFLIPPKDVAGLRESPQGPPEDQKGQMFHSIIKAEGSNLYLGSQTAENDGSSGEKRHVELDQTLILTKRN